MGFKIVKHIDFYHCGKYPDGTPKYCQKELWEILPDPLQVRIPIEFKHPVLEPIFEILELLKAFRLDVSHIAKQLEDKEVVQRIAGILESAEKKPRPKQPAS